MIAKQKITGGGQLTKNEQRIIESPAYTELALKLGISASGNQARADSDAALEGETAPTPSTRRLSGILRASGSMCSFQ